MHFILKYQILNVSIYLSILEFRQKTWDQNFLMGFSSLEVPSAPFLFYFWSQQKLGCTDDSNIYLFLKQWNILSIKTKRRKVCLLGCMPSSTIQCLNSKCYNLGQLVCLKCYSTVHYYNLSTISLPKYQHKTWLVKLSSCFPWFLFESKGRHRLRDAVIQSRRLSKLVGVVKASLFLTLTFKW